jgi:hypothetical protein
MALCKIAVWSASLTSRNVLEEWSRCLTSLRLRLMLFEVLVDIVVVREVANVPGPDQTTLLKALGIAPRTTQSFVRSKG